MARAARLSGAEPDDEEYQEFEEMLEHAETAQVRTVQNRINKTQNYWMGVNNHCNEMGIGQRSVGASTQGTSQGWREILHRVEIPLGVGD